jgi:hypothetical protein
MMACWVDRPLRRAMSFKCGFAACFNIEEGLLDPPHQNPHCFVFMIQTPRSRFVSACAKMHDDRLFVR